MEHVKLIIYLIDKLQEFLVICPVKACHRDAVMDTFSSFKMLIIDEFRAKDRTEHIQEAVE